MQTDAVSPSPPQRPPPQPPPPQPPSTAPELAIDPKKARGLVRWSGVLVAGFALLAAGVVSARTTGIGTDGPSITKILFTSGTLLVFVAKGPIGAYLIEGVDHISWSRLARTSFFYCVPPHIILVPRRWRIIWDGSGFPTALMWLIPGSAATAAFLAFMSGWVAAFIGL